MPSRHLRWWGGWWWGVPCLMLIHLAVISSAFIISFGANFHPPHPGTLREAVVQAAGVVVMVLSCPLIALFVTVAPPILLTSFVACCVVFVVNSAVWGAGVWFGGRWLRRRFAGPRG